VASIDANIGRSIASAPQGTPSEKLMRAETSSLVEEIKESLELLRRHL
jgi:hypothetical protein